MDRARLLLIGVTALAVAACEKVPIVDINAGFSLADVAWFEEEDTLFVFYQANAEQGLGPETQLELTVRTDHFELPWTPLSQLSTVHTHVPADCGPKSVCGSTSLALSEPPRDVRLRLRYHRSGEMTMNAPVALNIIGRGPAHTNRSLLVYGVFDETNTHVQWRARHQFPTLRNHEVQKYGLRRHFSIADRRHGAIAADFGGNPYGYGSVPGCPGALPPLDFGPVETTARAVFDVGTLPLSASESPVVCARATVTEAKRGTFEAVALARKNPQVRPAFPMLRSPITENTPIKFMLSPCRRTISSPHYKMQEQRLFLEDAPEICIDDWNARGFADELSTRFRTKIDEVRMQGRDMVLVLGLHHDDTTGRLGTVLEEALQKVLPFERDKSSPRVTGAFVYDSMARTVGRPELRRLVLWCPPNLMVDDLDDVPAAASSTCPAVSTMPDIELGPFRFNQIPILTTRTQYLRFIEKYSDGQAGRMTSMSFRAPEHTPLSENVPVGEFGTATFYNNELITAEPGDAFSYCPEADQRKIVFRIPGTPTPLGLESLPELHQLAPQPAYALGLFWDFPFLLKANYESSLAGAVTAYSFSVPFGIVSSNEETWASQLWTTGEFPVGNILAQCTRFCDHPTFDTSVTYNVHALFRDAYRVQCYRPLFPRPGDGGFPNDP
ncbi:hypothetical protein [Archangium violaceum]|uniref:Lipoprotein n=1 Tax=Archangium violaceum Cb vi76 TaxID=1406225 RepID=A0A084T1C1_9BACT|nr:hypothetical protein [Archangium violaceum]KFA94506.1 hypothetical protein Q664_02435 [Archangium violaceum Cb vi76]